MAAEVATWPGATAPDPLVPVPADAECRHQDEWLARDEQWRCQDCKPPLPGEVLHTRHVTDPSDANTHNAAAPKRRGRRPPEGQTALFDKAATEPGAAREGTP